MNRRTALLLLTLAFALLCAPAHPQEPTPQQVIQTGALNVPTELLTHGNQWSTLIPILSTPDRDLFIEDPANPAWLARNAENFVDRGRYTIAVVSFYKSRRPCREDQIRAGRSGSAGFLACNQYRYQIRHIGVDSAPNTVTLLYSAMVFGGGIIDPASIRRESRTHGFHELDPDSQKALSDANKIVAKQAHDYMLRQRNLPY